VALSSYRILTISNTIDVVHGGDVGYESCRLQREPEVPKDGIQLYVLT